MIIDHVVNVNVHVTLTINNCIGSGLSGAVELVVRIVRRTLFTFIEDSKYVVRAELCFFSCFLVCAIRILY